MISAGPALAECPAAADVSEDLAVLIEKARNAQTQIGGQDASNEMWKLWLMAPDAAAQEVLDRGMGKRRSFDYIGAIADFDALVAYCPNYAEGYNQRAFAHFLSENYDAALVDLDMALKITPQHVGAQSGRALTLMNMGRLQEARAQMLEAVENNPWLSERALLAEGAPLGPVGEEI